MTDKKELQREIDSINKKMDAMWQKQRDGYDNGQNTRRRTTTFNAKIGQLNDRLQFLKSELKKCNHNL